MPDYNKGKVYTIRSRIDDTFIYVGSTTQPLAVRWGGHKKDSRKEKCQNILIYKTINNNWEDWYIELYEEYPCDNKEQLNRREGEIIRLIGNLNSNIAGRTAKEWGKEYNIKNKEARNEYQKNYREEHKEELLAKDRARDRVYYNIKRREIYAERQAKKKHIEALNPV